MEKRSSEAKREWINMEGQKARNEANKVVPNWIIRLYAGAGLNVNENRLAWNAVHIEHFLGCCRRRGAGADRLELGELIRLHLEDLRNSEANQYRVDQAREALAVFYWGVSGWRTCPLNS
jgi:hypothetical protein